MSALSAPLNKPEDTLILVDERDHEIGFASKEACHQGRGLLHRAFSVFLFDRQGRVLLQQRSPQKPLWPRFWSNSCCSHPRRGESVELAAKRRVREELGIESELRVLYKFQYQAPFGKVGSEYEYCWVLAGFHEGTIQPNPDEIAACRHVAPAHLTAEIGHHPDTFTPWLKMEWDRISQEFLDDILSESENRRGPQHAG